jgi:anti-sigma factor RsiW
MSENDHFNCKALLGSLSDYVDGALSDELCQEIDRHLSECQDCRIVVDTLHKTVSLYQKSAADAKVPGGVRERLFRVLNLEDYLQR